MGARADISSFVPLLGKSSGCFDHSRLEAERQFGREGGHSWNSGRARPISLGGVPAGILQGPACREHSASKHRERARGGIGAAVWARLACIAFWSGFGALGVSVGMSMYTCTVSCGAPASALHSSSGDVQQCAISSSQLAIHGVSVVFTLGRGKSRGRCPQPRVAVEVEISSRRGQDGREHPLLDSGQARAARAA